MDLHDRPERDRRRAASAPPPTVADPPELVAPGLTPDEEAEASWNSWRVHRALETLPENERAVIDLAYFSGFSQSEVAGFLSCRSARSRHGRAAALARLADALEGEL